MISSEKNRPKGSTMLPVVAIIKAKPGKEIFVEEMLRAVIGPTLKEDGCLRYDLHRDKADPRVFIFIEQWQSEEALKAHLASPHVRAGMARMDELMDMLEIRRLTPVA
jgi:quinol monooxygenase YgiN